MNKKDEKKSDFRVALVHDFLTGVGGAERVLRHLSEMYPSAPIYTLLYEREAMRGMFEDRTVVTSFLQKFPRFVRRRKQWLLPLLPVAPETFDLREFDVVISSSGAWSKGVVSRVTTAHIAYIHSPMRFVWDENIRYARTRLNREPGFCLRAVLSYLRLWDHEAALRPDVLVANSRYTAERIGKFYRRQSRVVYPPLEEEFLNQPEKPVKKGNYFLLVSRLSAAKNPALAVDVCNKLNLSLVVVGVGEEYENLKKIAGKTVKFVGFCSDERLRDYYRRARALLFPTEEDFGLAMVESLACGTPVIAYGRGGASEIISPGLTGELFGAETPEVMADGIRRFLEKEKKGGYDRELMRRTAEKFSLKTFREAIEEIVNEAVDKRWNYEKKIHRT